MFTDLFSSLGVLVFATTIIVEVLKKILPDKIPTQALTIVVSVLCAIGITLCLPEITIAALVKGVFTGFAAAFISMNGFDTFKNLYGRFTTNNIDEDKEDE